MHSLLPALGESDCRKEEQDSWEEMSGKEQN
jgi:hypothetical protein